MRWIVHALSMELFGDSLSLAEFRKRKDVRGIGMSDPIPIAEVLARRFTYQNTFFDRPPRLDITDVEGSEQYDFIIVSEVFEHIQAPVQKAFDNLARLLKRDGFGVFSVPYEAEGRTIEHFPRLHDWQLVSLNSGRVLVNRTPEGKLEVFDDLNFHGGPGSTLEMRIFSEEDLLQNCRAAGFRSVRIAEDVPVYGVSWEPWARGFVLKKAN